MAEDCLGLWRVGDPAWVGASGCSGHGPRDPVIRFNVSMLSHPPAQGAPLVDGDLVAGVLSGTSADGMDVAVGRIAVRGHGGDRRVCGVEATQLATVPMATELSARVREVLDGGAISLPKIALLDRDLGLAFGAAVRRVAGPDAPLGLVASHGQTVFHHDGDPGLGKVTMQLGDGDFVAEAAGCAVASDFRTRDCAAGGEGAPLVVLVDDVLFSAAPRPLAILNLGGIANWTLLRAGAPPAGSDAGPAGALLDGLARAVLNRPMDRDGVVAARGEVRLELLEALNGHPFLERPWPKSTGLDTFGPAYLGAFMASAPGASAEDLLATATRFVARAAVGDLLRGGRLESLQGGVEVAVAGGGARNPTLMGAIEEELQAQLQSRGGRLSGFGPSDRHGVPSDFREALAFAVLGARLAVGEVSSRPEVTGALGGRILGKWSSGPRIGL